MLDTENAEIMTARPEVHEFEVLEIGVLTTTVSRQALDRLKVRSAQGTTSTVQPITAPPTVQGLRRVERYGMATRVFGCIVAWPTALDTSLWNWWRIGFCFVEPTPVRCVRPKHLSHMHASGQTAVRVSASASPDGPFVEIPRKRQVLSNVSAEGEQTVYEVVLRDPWILPTGYLARISAIPFHTVSGYLDGEGIFGASVAALGDLDEDGVNDIAVGAYQDDNDDGWGLVTLPCTLRRGVRPLPAGRRDRPLVDKVPEGRGGHDPVAVHG